MDQRNTTRSIIIIMIGVIVAGSSLTAIHTLSADTTNPKHINSDNNSYHEGNSNSNNNISPARQQQWVIQNVGISPSNEDSGGRDDVGVSGDISVSGNVSAEVMLVFVVNSMSLRCSSKQQQLQEQQQGSTN